MWVKELKTNSWVLCRGKTADKQSNTDAIVTTFLMEVLGLIELHFIVLLDIMNRAIYIESTRLYMPDKGEREMEPTKKEGNGLI